MRHAWALAMGLAVMTCFGACLSNDTVGSVDGGTTDGGDTGEVGPSGGVVVSDSKAVILDIPAGALDETVTIEIKPAGDAPQGHVGNAYNLLPDGLSFKVPITVKFAYDPTSLGVAAENSLALATVVNGAWHIIADSAVDTTAKVVSGKTDHFSQYGVISKPVCTTDADCASSAVCTAGLCEQKTVTNCNADNECPAHHVCSNGVCEETDGGSGDGGGDAGTVCTNDDECGVGLACINGICEGIYCRTGADCAAGEVCVNGYCEAADGGPDYCGTDADCGSGKACVSGVCQTRP